MLCKFTMESIKLNKFNFNICNLIFYNAGKQERITNLIDRKKRGKDQTT